MMTMAIDHQQQRQYGAMNFDNMPYSTSTPFTNPWSSSSAPPPPQNLFPSSHSLGPNMGLNTIAKEGPPRHNNHVSMSSYASMPSTAASAGSSHLANAYGHEDLLTMPQDLMSQNRVHHPQSYGHDGAYTSSVSTHPTYATSTGYDSMNYAPMRSSYSLQSDSSRRLSQPSVPSITFLNITAEGHRQHRQNSLIDFNDRSMNAESTRSFGDAIDASRGMIAMSQADTTPRNIYGPGSRTGRGSGDSYGFPSHSTSSSISSNGTYPAYFGNGGSVDSSVSEYSNTGSDIESTSSRTLPRPSGFLNGGLPPAPSSMMGQFSSKVSSSTQKKHKCKVCDKRFTRPSSLQTHMYSHTGEKRKSKGNQIQMKS
jgi:hypothetical protein